MTPLLEQGRTTPTSNNNTLDISNSTPSSQYTSSTTIADCSATTQSVNTTDSVAVTAHTCSISTLEDHTVVDIEPRGSADSCISPKSTSPRISSTDVLVTAITPAVTRPFSSELQVLSS